MEPIDLNLGKNVLEHWSVSDALREIISNALDEHTKHNIKKIPIIKQNKRNDYFEIMDYGTGIKLKDFIQNANMAKVNDERIIGTFGFGLKDALGVLCKKEIDFEILTNEYIFTPKYIKKQRGETLHIFVEENKRRMSDEFGTRFVFKNLRTIDMNKAKQLFLQLNSDMPNILYEDKTHNKIFKFEGKKQSIYVNGVKIINNSGYHFSYDLNKNKSFLTSFNRDRQNININIFKKPIQTILENLELFDVNNKILNKEVFDNIKKILTSLKLKEFSYVDILRNLIEQLNSIDKYIFVDKSDKIHSSIIKEKIEKSKRTVFVLNDEIKKKFKKNGKRIKNIKELYYNEVFYKVRELSNDSKNIFTLMACESKITRDQTMIREKIGKLIEEIKKKLNIELDDKIEEKLLNITIDENLDSYNEDNNDESYSDDSDDNEEDNNDSDEEDNDENNNENNIESEDEEDEEDYKINKLYNPKEGYDFTDDELKISVKLSKNDNKLKTIIIYKYILPNLNDSDQLVLFQKLIETATGTSWFNWF
jgi:hypothetical protein